MRLPGTRYQEHGWEQVRKMLGQCSLEALAHADLERVADLLPDYVDAMATLLAAQARRYQGEAPGNSYGESVAELALGLLFELQARPGDWAALADAVGGEAARLGPFWRQPGGEAVLRKKFNDMYAVLRDKVDADNYAVACGRPCSANRIYTYRMLDTAWSEIARLLTDWRAHADQVGAILGRPILAEPIEARQATHIGECRAEWVIRWSESLERFEGKPGPLHTKSKRFASLRNNPDTIRELLQEIGEYEALSSNRDAAWLHDAAEAEEWIDDLWRVLDEVSPAPGYGEEDRPAHPGLQKMAEAFGADPLSVRIAVFHKLLGSRDDSYPADWLDPETGELPGMEALAGQAGISVPTLRKRRDAAIARLQQSFAT
jgi:hypothetical protein